MSKGEQSRALILKSAIELFGESGYRATSVTDIARHAGVSGTLAYAYFDNKEALFLAALDHDAAELIEEGVQTLLETVGDDTWRTDLIATLVVATDQHPLARRLLAGLEPGVTERVADLQALADLRTRVADRIRADQAAGLARTDVDADVLGSGIVSIMMSLLITVMQLGRTVGTSNLPDVMSVLSAALDRPDPTDQPDPTDEPDPTDQPSR